MRITRLILLVIVAGAFALAGCGGGEDQAKLDEAKEDVAQKTEEVKEGVEETAEEVKEGKAEDVKEGIEKGIEEVKDLADLANTVCPVCGMTLEDDHATLEYKGKKIHVCSDHCKEAFMKDPEKCMANLMKEKMPKMGEGE